MTRSLRNDAVAIWSAGLAAVDSERLVRTQIERDDGLLKIAGVEYDLRRNGRIVVVGAGKAGAGMSAGFEMAVGDELLEERVTGWVNVPADCVRSLRRIHLHGARPAGLNEPTQAGVVGTRRMLELVAALDKADLCVVLLSGGGSALAPAPVPGISLEEKRTVTRVLMHTGATIDELNCVRKHLSQFKGGNLARACTAGTLVALMISDVVGDPLETIGSGPTVADPTTAADALEILRRERRRAAAVPRRVIDYLTKAASGGRVTNPLGAWVHNVVIGNNDTALAAAAAHAEALGYRVHSLGSANRGEAREAGSGLADLCADIRDRHVPVAPPACALSGGEPVVALVETDQPRKGGRNQELALSALQRLWDSGLNGIALVSGGTDGEDGPTDAAGAIVDAEVMEAARAEGLAPADFLAINNSYPFFEATGGLLKTGPTHTNVMDLRVAVVGATTDHDRPPDSRGPS